MQDSPQSSDVVTVTYRFGRIHYRLLVYVRMMSYLCARTVELYRVVCVGR